MENKLTLEHIAPYLPYGLRLQIEESNSSLDNFRITMDRIDSTDGVYAAFDWFSLNNPESCVKPILRPLSDLTKDDDFNFNLSLELCDILNTNSIEHFIKAVQEKTYYAIDLRLYGLLEAFLYKHHFDWKFDLIPRGLAIDINTVKS